MSIGVPAAKLYCDCATVHRASASSYTALGSAAGSQVADQDESESEPEPEEEEDDERFRFFFLSALSFGSSLMLLAHCFYFFISLT